MPDREKTRRGLLHCLVEPMCANCPYWKPNTEKRFCQAELLEDADVLMKEQAEAIQSLEKTVMKLLEQIKELGSN